VRISLVILVSVWCLSACATITSRKYEYEEEIFLDLDGSATIYVNASVPALVALRGATLPVDPAARLDRQLVRGFYETPVTSVGSVTASRREGRRYVHLRLDVPDITRLHEATPFAWSSYRYQERDGRFELAQVMGKAAGQEVGQVGWEGDELIAVRVHLPSRVTFHNSPSRTIERGNIVVWEQLLADRRKGVPLEIEVRMETESILIRTLLLFGAMALLVVATFAGVIWYVRSRGPKAEGG